MGAPDRVRSLFVPFANGHTEHTQNQSLIIACSAARRCAHLGLCGLGLRGLPVWLCAFVASWPVWPLAFVARLCGSMGRDGLCGPGLRGPQ